MLPLLPSLKEDGGLLAYAANSTRQAPTFALNSIDIYRRGALIWYYGHSIVRLIVSIGRYKDERI
jgi:hypothetical protein